MKQHINFIFTFLLALFLTSCGGDRNNDQISSPIEANQEKSVGINSSVPLATRQLVNSIVVPTSLITTQSPVTFPSSVTESDQLIIATKDDTPLLLGFTKWDDSLSAETTAISLIRLSADDPYPENITIPNLVASIKNAPSYATLLNEINTSLSKGNSPIENEATLVAVNKVVQELGSVLPPSDGTVLLAALEYAVAFPFDFFRVDANDHAFLTNSAGVGIKFNNRTAIHWKVTVVPSVGKTEYYAPPRESKARQLFADYSGSESVTDILGTEPQFTVSIGQDATTRFDNRVLLVIRLTKIIAEITFKADKAATTECAAFVTKKFMQENLSDIIAKPSGQAVLNYLVTVFGAGSGGDAARTLTEYTKACLSSRPRSAPSYERAPDVTKRYSQLLSALKMAPSVLATTDNYIQMTKYDTYANSINICKFGGELVPCAFKIDINPKEPKVSPGKSARLSGSLVSTFTGNPVDSTQGFKWRSNDRSVATVNPDTGEVSGVSIGKTRIFATDINTTTEGSVDLLVSTSLTGPVNLGGTINVPGTICSGPYSISGTSTVDLTPGSENIRIQGSEIISMNCFSQTVQIDVIVPLSKTSNTLNGEVHNPYICSVTCRNGITDVKVDLELSATGTDQSATGTIRFQNTNDSGSIGIANGKVVVK